MHNFYFEGERFLECVAFFTIPPPLGEKFVLEDKLASFLQTTDKCWKLLAIGRDGFDAAQFKSL